MATEFNITNGPSKFDLMLALFDGVEDRTLLFTTEVGNFVTVVSKVRHIHDEGWEIAGRAWDETALKRGVTLGLPRPKRGRNEDEKFFIAMYNTKSPRNGTFRII